MLKYVTRGSDWAMVRLFKWAFVDFLMTWSTDTRLQSPRLRRTTFAVGRGLDSSYIIYLSTHRPVGGLLEKGRLS